MSNQRKISRQGFVAIDSAMRSQNDMCSCCTESLFALSFVFTRGSQSVPGVSRASGDYHAVHNRPNPSCRDSQIETGMKHKTGFTTLYRPSSGASQPRPARQSCWLSVWSDNYRFFMTPKPKRAAPWDRPFENPNCTRLTRPWRGPFSAGSWLSRRYGPIFPGVSAGNTAWLGAPCRGAPR
jgi:hypothetical protein